MYVPLATRPDFTKIKRRVTTKLSTRRIYDPPSETDGTRILVDRLWPRGLAKDKAKIDYWFKILAPSNDLRKWFSHDPDKWDEFKRRYFRELDENGQAVTELLEKVGNKKAVLLFAAKETRMNNAVALKEYLDKYRARRS